MSEASVELQFNNVYYNSEWGKLLLLLWKKSRINWQNFGKKILTFLAPISFITVLLMMRFTNLPKPSNKIYTYPVINLSFYWEELVKTIDERKMLMDKRLPG